MFESIDFAAEERRILAAQPYTGTIDTGRFASSRPVEWLVLPGPEFRVMRVRRDGKGVAHPADPRS